MPHLDVWDHLESQCLGAHWLSHRTGWWSLSLCLETHPHWLSPPPKEWREISGKIMIHLTLLFKFSIQYLKCKNKPLYLIELGMKGATELHVLDQVGPLALIRSNDANLIRFCSSLQQPRGYFLHVGCLGPAWTRTLIYDMLWTWSMCIIVVWCISKHLRNVKCL